MTVDPSGPRFPSVAVISPGGEGEAGRRRTHFCAFDMAHRVGQRVSVRWTGDPGKPWFDGTICEYFQSTGEHLVLFDDGDQKAFDLRAEEAGQQLKWLDKEGKTAAKKSAKRAVGVTSKTITKKQLGKSAMAIKLTKATEKAVAEAAKLLNVQSRKAIANTAPAKKPAAKVPRPPVKRVRGKAPKRRSRGPTPGSDLIGKRISIRWTGDVGKPWFSGTVAEFNPISEEYLIRYDDGDQQAHNLANEEEHGLLKWLS